MGSVIIAAIALGLSLLFNGLLLAYSYGRLNSRVDRLEKDLRVFNGVPTILASIQSDVSNISTHVTAMNTEMGQMRDNIGHLAERVATIEGILKSKA